MVIFVFLLAAETYRKENLADENVHNITKVCMKEFKKYIKSLLTTPTYVLLVLADGTDGFLLSALASFLPLVIEKQFGVTASQASLYAGDCLLNKELLNVEFNNKLNK